MTIIIIIVIIIIIIVMIINRNLRDELEPPQHENISVTVDTVKQFLTNVPDWKEPEPDIVQGFWIKNFTSLHTSIANILHVVFRYRQCPWLDDKRQNDTHHERPRERCSSRKLTCLPVMWKLLTGIMSDKLYEILDAGNILPDEQNRCIKGAQGTNDHQLLIDK